MNIKISPEKRLRNYPKDAASRARLALALGLAVGGAGLSGCLIKEESASTGVTAILEDSSSSTQQSGFESTSSSQADTIIEFPPEAGVIALPISETNPSSSTAYSGVSSYLPPSSAEQPSSSSSSSQPQSWDSSEFRLFGSSAAPPSSSSSQEIQIIEPPPPLAGVVVMPMSNIETPSSTSQEQ